MLVSSSRHALLLTDQSCILKVLIPQKYKLLNNVFEPFLEYSPPGSVSKNTMKKIGHHVHYK